MSKEATLRADIWLWRARFFKSRALAARFVEDGRVRRTRGAAESRLDKASRTVQPGDRLLFVIGGKPIFIEVEAIGARRGPPEEARGLYSPVENY
jgi:ribosome-associated heat shock protein Hsp15